MYSVRFTARQRQFSAIVAAILISSLPVSSVWCSQTVEGSPDYVPVSLEGANADLHNVAGLQAAQTKGTAQVDALSLKPHNARLTGKSQDPRPESIKVASRQPAPSKDAETGGKEKSSDPAAGDSTGCPVGYTFFPPTNFPPHPPVPDFSGNCALVNQPNPDARATVTTSYDLNANGKPRVLQGSFGPYTDVTQYIHYDDTGKWDVVHNYMVPDAASLQKYTAGISGNQYVRVTYSGPAGFTNIQPFQLQFYEIR